MRRKILKNKKIIISLVIVAGFTFLSFFFDQLVVQQENKIRKFNTEISNERIKINQNLFLINSIFSVSKDTAYSGQIMKHTLDDAYSRRYLFNPEEYGKEKENILISGVKAFEKHLIFHDDLFLKILEKHNQKADLIKFYLENFKKNDIFLKSIEESEYNLEPLKKEFDNLYISKGEFEYFKKIRKNLVDWSVTATNQDPFWVFYGEVRDKITKLSYIGDMIYATGEGIAVIHVNKLDEYEKNLLNFSRVKNDKNFFILLSILFQILALTSLMYLFKIIINQEKK